jgi:hypothetical protein
VANHSPRTPRSKQTWSKDICSGDFPFLSNIFITCIEVTSGTLALKQFINNLFWDLTVYNACNMVRFCRSPLAVPSDEHTPLSEIVV